MTRSVLTACLCWVIVGSALADKGDAAKLPPPADKKNVTFAADIKPIFDRSCVRCHGEEKPKNKLRLDSLSGVLKGGEHGKPVVPGKSAESGLVFAVAHVGGDPDLWMPPKDNKAKILPLTKEEIGLIRAWIDQGAK
jgi:hypothetical protein